MDPSVLMHRHNDAATPFYRHSRCPLSRGSDASITLTASLESGSGTLYGTLTAQAERGIAKFRGLRIGFKGAPGVKRLRFTPTTTGECGCITPGDSPSLTVRDAKVPRGSDLTGLESLEHGDDTLYMGGVEA